MVSGFVQERESIYKRYSGLQKGNNEYINQYILQLFKFQYKYNLIYQEYCKNLGVLSDLVTSIEKIPFLPISAFKHHDVKCGDFEPDIIFTSSGSTGPMISRHLVKDLQYYITNTEKIWNIHFKSINDYCFFALLPGYLERRGSSLICMMNHFISRSFYKQSGFYLRNHEELYKSLCHCKASEIPAVLVGVTHALLDFSEEFPIDFPQLLVIETGGMKGTRLEITKYELHQILNKRFGTDKIYSEYGMTELLSQAYTSGGILFQQNPFIRVLTKQLNDPLHSEKLTKPGIICVMDLANIDSCAFIQTEDMGALFADGSFEISGRMEASDIRGCNLLLQEVGLI